MNSGTEWGGLKAEIAVEQIMVQHCSWRRAWRRRKWLLGKTGGGGGGLQIRTESHCRCLEFFTSRVAAAGLGWDGDGLHFSITSVWGALHSPAAPPSLAQRLFLLWCLVLMLPSLGFSRESCSKRVDPPHQIFDAPPLNTFLVACSPHSLGLESLAFLYYIYKYILYI